MPRRLEQTFEILKATRNESALDVLVSGLDSPCPAIQDASFRALLERRSAAGHRELVRRWDRLSDAWKSVIAERPTWMEGALRAAILSTDFDLHRNACQAVVSLREYDLIPTLVSAAEDKGNTHAELAARATLHLCAILYEEWSAPRDYRLRRDPALVRQFVAGTLEPTIQHYEQHSRPELVEAYLLLARSDDTVLRQAILQTYGRVQSTLIHLLSTSARPGVLRLIFHFLDDPQPPPGIASVVAHRRDITFVRALCAKFSAPMSTAARANVRRIDNLAFLRDDVQLLQDLDEDEQCGLVSFVLATSLNRLRVFELLKAAMARGQTRVRRTACAGLVEFKGDDANHLVLAALEDPDPEVQSLAVQQVRERGIPNILPRLVELIDSPHEVVRAAVRATLTEFNFQRYLGVFEVLDPEVRRSTGSLVKRIDPWAIEHLIQELVSPVRARRLRGIAVAVAMRAVRDVEKHIVELAADDDHFVRADAARALLQAGSSVAHQTLENLLMDRSVSVQEAAAQSLARWTEPILEQSARPYLPHEHPILPLGTNEVVP